MSDVASLHLRNVSPNERGPVRETCSNSSRRLQGYLWTIRRGLELRDPRPLPPTRNYSKSSLAQLLEINNVCFFLLLFFPLSDSSLTFIGCFVWVSSLRALRCWMFNITRAIIYAWRAGQRPHNLDQWAELACSTTLRLVPYGVYLVTLYLNASSKYILFSVELSTLFR